MKIVSTNEFLKKLNEISDFKEYELLSEYKGSKEKIKLLHKKCGNIFDMKSNNFTSNNQRCPVCFGKKLKTQKEIENDIFNLVGNEYVVKSNYKNYNTKILLLHNISSCNKEYLVTPADFLSGGYRCPHCSGNYKIKKEDLEEKIKKLDKEYSLISIPDDYKNVHSKILIKHELCENTFSMSYNNFRNGQRCPICMKKQ